MRKATLGAAMACLVLGAGTIAQPAAAARYHDQERYMGNYCDRHSGDRDCWDWNHHRDRWDEDRYHSWYHRHHDEFGPDDAAAALFGFVAGAAANAITGGVNTSHRAACENHYRSYDWRSDTYMGFDGDRHSCRL